MRARDPRGLVRAARDGGARGGRVDGSVYDRGEGVPLGQRCLHRVAAYDACDGERG